MEVTITGIMKVASGTQAAWMSTTAVIPKDVICFETDTGKAKVTDGVNLYSALPYGFGNLDDATKDRLADAGLANGFALIGADGFLPMDIIPMAARNKVRFVADVAARDALPSDQRDAIVMVIDASADTTVDAGAAYYAWNGSEWIKIWEQESMDIDFGQFMDADATLDDIPDGINFVRMTPAERLAIADQGTRLSAAETAITALQNSTATSDAVNAERDRAILAEQAIAASVTTLSDHVDSVETALSQQIVDASAAAASLVGTEQARAEGAEVALGQRIDDVEADYMAADAVLQAAINASATNLSWRPGVFVVTADPAAYAAIANGDALSDILPFSDDDPTQLSLGDFSVGKTILCIDEVGSNYALAKVIDDAGTLRLSSTGVQALSEHQTFVVANDLLDAPGSQENRAIYTYTGTELVKLGDFDWSLATGIDLSPLFAGAAGVVVAGDSVEGAIAKIVGNLAEEITRATAAEGVLSGAIGVLANLTTTVKSSLVAAINELVTRVDGLVTDLAAVADGVSQVASDLATLDGQVVKHTDIVTFNSFGPEHWTV